MAVQPCLSLIWWDTLKTDFLVTMLKYLFVFQAQFTEKKSVEKYSIPSCFQILSEIGEATSAILDNKVRYAPVLQYF